ncbi:methyltransferase [Ferroplasma acidiphilum]|uniref:Methyltransferase n=1 Tax=Ferroplasma acidiphilum TaxID=74969 RepID=A0A1V0N2C4_9ARCH|nr:rRNA adenine N-6-methyltransferase family protein [Ferroplasma acidiphilum]ARD84288.1 methyltransferase [Ferroplasma acidiphilum]
MRYERIKEFREKYIPYNKIVEKMDLKPDDVIIDMGAGDGFYSKLFADKLKNGKVYAIERNPDVLPHLQRNLMEMKNFEVVNENMCHVDIKGFNKIFFSTVFHDIECREDIIDFMIRNSKKPLNVYLIEFNKKSAMGPPLDIRICHDELNKIFTESGFQPGLHMDFEYNYFDSYYLEK